MTDENVLRGTVQQEPVVMYGMDIDDEKLPILKHRLTVADYHKMGEAGIFDEDARVELIDGELFDLPPIGSGHAGVVRIPHPHIFKGCGGISPRGRSESRGPRGRLRTTTGYSHTQAA